MEFSFTETENAFRRDLRSFLTQELPDDWAGGAEEEDEDWEFTLQMRRKLAEKGWRWARPTPRATRNGSGWAT